VSDGVTGLLSERDPHKLGAAVVRWDVGHSQLQPAVGGGQFQVVASTSSAQPSARASRASVVSSGMEPSEAASSE
jgi:hypothetical protein